MTIPGRHYERQGLYRARRGWIFGVCRGFANYSGISLGWVRLGFVVLLLASGFWPAVLIYIVAAVFMKPAPVIAPSTDDDWEFYGSYAVNRGMAIGRLKRKFDEIDRRARRLESIVTARGFRWEKRLGAEYAADRGP